MIKSLSSLRIATCRFWRALSCATLLVLTPGLLAQNPDADPRFGSSTLRIGFDPDPFLVDISAGGTVDVGHLGNECLGYVNSEQPDHVLNYQAGGATLGIFVASDVDATLVINDPAGNWHCNDDSDFLIDLNPGLALKRAPAGNYQVWVGTYDNSGNDAQVKLVFTEEDINSWSSMNISVEPDTSDLPLATDIASIDFGDDNGEYSNDGECDDPRFEGAGMAFFPDEADQGHDNTDCRSAYSVGEIRLTGEWGTTSSPAISADGIEFGDNSSSWANDGECDDPRFSGSGMASSPGSENTLHDAADCLELYQSGQISLGSAPTQVVEVDISDIDFGDDTSTWSEDGECDDPRFAGSGMASFTDEGDRLHDATDCRTLFEAGSIQLLATPDAAPIISIDTSGVDFGDDASVWSDDGECDDPRFEGNSMAASLNNSDMFHDATDCESLMGNGSVRLRDDAAADAPDSDTVDATVDANNNAMLERGSLENDDNTLPDDSFYDTYTFAGNVGQTAVVDLRSGEFDTYLIVESPSGERFENDDYQDSFERSLLSLDLNENGTYEVTVTSYEGGETGGYTVEIETIATQDDLDAIQHSGSLASGDSTYSTGEFYDSYTFQGKPGQSVTVDLRSSDFDTYLVVTSPDGEDEVNDDTDSVGRSTLELQLTELGSYEVHVTSYKKNETGQYDLDINYGSNIAVRAENLTPARLALGDTIQGQLEGGDRLSSEGEFEDSYVFSGESGDSVTVEMNSSAIDTYLRLITPAGEAIENDDYEGSTDRSRLEITLKESGRYRIIASSYGSNETGNYLLSLTSGSSADPMPISTGDGQIYGIFAGIADYPGTENDLAYTDQDAVRVRDALIEGAGMNSANAITLLDAQATVANMRGAINDMSTRVGSADTLVVFYSGHGDRIIRSAGPDSRDPDGMDETIDLYDGSIIDDQLNDMLNTVNAGTILLVMDSCFSGGFSKDIVSVPGRMGLFSSEEDVTSQVAFKFQAGGYLSVFFDEAIRGGYADRDENGELTALELSQYLHDRYREDVKSIGGDDYVRTSGPQSSYQHLVVDRGGVGPYSVLFNRRSL